MEYINNFYLKSIYITMIAFKTLTEKESKVASAIKLKIYDAIVKKQMNEMIPCDKNNPANYGEVNFFLVNGEDGSYIVWDKHSKEWDEKAIMHDIYEQEYYIARRRALIGY